MSNRNDRIALLTSVLLLAGACAGSALPRNTGGEGGDGGSSEGGAGGSPGGGTGGSGAGSGGGGAGASGGNGGATGGSGGSAGKDAGAPERDGASPPPPPGPIGADWPACAKTVMVADSGALGAAISGAAPGDCLMLADGNYAGLTITAKGNAEAPIILRAVNRGKATFTSAISLNGAMYIGFDGANYSGGANITVNNANGNRVSRGVFKLGGGPWITLIGNSSGNRIDHNEMGPIPAGGEAHFVTPTNLSEKTRIDHNYFHDNPPGGNGRESIRLGCCGAMYDAHETGNIVEHNLFVNCDGESEMIGMKSSLNTVRYNTIRASQGQISFRAGKKNQVYGNYMLGEGKAGTQGIRMLDENHVVYNNYVEVTGFALRVQNGDAPGFPPVKNAVIVHNTFIVRGGALELGGTGHSVPPAASVFQNNLIWGTSTLINESSNPGFDYKGNIAFSMGGTLGVTKPAEQFKVVDPMMVKVGEVMKPAPGSPVAGAGVGSFPFVTGDIDEQMRSKADVGAHAVPAAMKGPLTPVDVGPNSP
jgi:hypothetical protein